MHLLVLPYLPFYFPDVRPIAESTYRITVYYRHSFFDVQRAVSGGLPNVIRRILHLAWIEKFLLYRFSQNLLSEETMEKRQPLICI